MDRNTTLVGLFQSSGLKEDVSISFIASKTWNKLSDLR